MKKNYILTCALLLTGILSQAQTTSTTPTFVVTELSSPVSAEGAIYRESKYNAEIEVTVRNVTDRVWAGSHYIHCLPEPNTVTDYPYLEMVNPAGNEEGDNSFVEIHSLGEANIEKVEFVLGSANTSYLVASTSIDGSDYFNSDYETDIAYSVYKLITVEGMDDICNSTYSYTVPNFIEDTWGTSGVVITDAREKLKYVRLNWGKDFAGSTSTNLKTSVNLLAIQVYTDADTGVVGIEEGIEESITIELYGRNLQLSELSDVMIYDYSGVARTSYTNIDNAYLDTLSEGVYIIQARNTSGMQTTQKVVVK